MMVAAVVFKALVGMAAPKRAAMLAAEMEGCRCLSGGNGVTRYLALIISLVMVPMFISIFWIAPKVLTKWTTMAYL